LPLHFRAICSNAIYRLLLALMPRDQFLLLFHWLVRDELGLDRFAGQVYGAEINVVVDMLGGRVSAGGVVDDQESAAFVRQERRPVIEQSAGVVQFDRLAPVVAVEPASEGEPVGAGVRRVAGAELLPVGEPRSPLAVDADLRVGV